MKTSILRAAQNFLYLGCWFVVLGVNTPALGSNSDVIQIEEHWQLHVGGPDVARTAPQVTMIMSPTNSLNGTFFSFTLNHWSYPNFESGGYQLQHWQGDQCVEVKHGAKPNTFASDGEVVSWVQRITLTEGNLKFQVVEGDSDTWNSFGGEGFSLNVPTELTRLNSYLPSISLFQSGIGYAGNRVSSLTLTRLRWKTRDGESHEMVAPIDIDTDLD